MKKRGQGYSHLTLEKIEEAFKSFLKEKREDPNFPPDLSIVEHDTTFAVTTSNPKITTGMGGFKRLLETGVPFMKVEYNGKIMSDEEFQNLKERILK